MSTVTDELCRFYQDLTVESMAQLGRIYSPNAQFQDPLHHISGLDQITNYFENLLANVNYCRFQVDEVVEAGDQAFITWVMDFSHPKLNNGKPIKLPDSSHLKFNDVVFYQRDYYDMGHMVYEQIPLLGYIIGKIKGRLTS